MSMEKIAMELANFFLLLLHINRPLVASNVKYTFYFHYGCVGWCISFLSFIQLANLGYLWKKSESSLTSPECYFPKGWEQLLLRRENNEFHSAQAVN